MKKNYLLLSVCILSLLSGCNNSNVDGSSTISSSSSSNEVISSTSSYNDYVSSSDKIVNVKLNDLIKSTQSGIVRIFYK